MKVWGGNEGVQEGSYEHGVYRVTLGGVKGHSLVFRTQALKDKAVAIADKLMPAFNTPSGIPKSLVNLQT